MSGRISAHLRSNMVGYIALFIALGGVGYAAGLERDSVKSKQIKDGAVRSIDVADGALTGTDVADDGLTGADIVESSLDLPSGASDTPAELLEKLKTVDGSGSELDADKLDDFDSSDFYTRVASDARYPLGETTFFNMGANTTQTFIPFASFAEIDLACDAGGAPSVSLQNISGTNLRIYADDGGATAVNHGVVANGASTPVTAGAAADGSVDRVTYIARGPGPATVTIDVWMENVGAAATNCIITPKAIGLGVLVPN